MGFEEIFEKKPKINIAMNGKDYVHYLKYKEYQRRKKRLTKRQKQGVIILGLCVLGMFLILYLLHDLTYTPNQYKLKVYSVIGIIPTLMQFSWLDILKISFLFSAPVLLVIISVAWILHGVQLKLLA